MPGKEDGNIWSGLPRLAWLVTLLLPPSAVAALAHGLVREHPVIAVLAVIAYWAVVTVGRFVTGMVRDLVQRRRTSWIEGADRALGIRLTRFKGKYLHHLARSLHKIDQKGLSTPGFYTPDLDDVYIDVSLAVRAPNQIRGDLLADAASESTERRSITDFLDGVTPAVIAIVGAPGSGKTTLLRYTTRRICQHRKGRRRTIPILLYLRDHVHTVRATPRIALDKVVHEALGRLAPDEPPGWFERQIRDGNCLVLLDGLDEVASEADRRRVADWIELQIREYPENDYVITSRPRGYEATPIEGATVLQTRRFTDEQMSQFISSWYATIERHASGGQNDEVLARSAEEGAEDLRRRLREAPGLYELTANPLLLTMIANVHRFRGSLPGSRFDLYSEICQVMLYRRLEAKKLAVEPRGDQKEMLLRVLALEMMKRRVRDLTRAECLAILKPAVRRVSRELSAESFLDDVSMNGLVIERENSVYAFTHFTFQEYLAAARLKEKGLVSVLVDAVDDDWWRECTLLYAARSDPGPIIEACLRSRGPAALALAFYCADEAGELAPELQDELNHVLEHADPGSVQHTRLVASVLVARHLHQLVYASNGSRICALPVNWEIYALFLRDTQGRRRPDAAATPGTDHEIALGTRASDAAAFVAWVNDLLGGDLFHRLPTPEELGDRRVQRIIRRTGVCYWTQPAAYGASPVLWIPEGTPHPGSVEGGLLREDVIADLRRRTPALIAIFLVRAKSSVGVLLRLLDTAPDPGLDRALAQLTDLAAALNTALANSLVRAFDIGLNLEFGLNRDSARIREVVNQLSAEMPREAIPEFVRELAWGLVTDLTTGLGLAPRDESPYLGDLDRIRGALLALRHDLERDRRRSARTRDLARDHASARDRVHDLAIGRALSQSLSRSLLRDHRRPEAVVDGFAEQFAATARIGDTGFTVSPDGGHRMVTDAVAEIQGLLLKAPNLLPSTLWAAEMAKTLERVATPAFDRSEDLTDATATAIRLGALCLAVEADIRRRTGLGDLFRHIAAGATWLERRRTGRSNAAEAIVIASD
ncbi:NACHT domain-containing protein [Actinoallomurus acaciae]|uniref:NACHT domain-containing protein n=1 Tax=Actinoallomurus acaciae TaxID=502577 RepID=A0ABV5YNN2_9ACTN